MTPRVRYLIRIGAAPLYAIAVVVSVFTGGVVWVAVIGGILLSMVYMYSRGGLDGGAGGRQRNRNRNRNRNRGGGAPDDVA